MNKDNNWFKLFALMVVGGVAKALFGPEPRVAVHRTTLPEAVTAVKEIIPDRKEEKDIK